MRQKRRETGDTSVTDVPGQNVLEMVEAAYHNGEIADAISSLTPSQQRYVKARFWKGMNDEALTSEFGYQPHNLWSNKRYGAKQRLAEQLKYLEKEYG